MQPSTNGNGRERVEAEAPKGGCSEARRGWHLVGRIRMNFEFEPTGGSGEPSGRIPALPDGNNLHYPLNTEMTPGPPSSCLTTMHDPVHRDESKYEGRCAANIRYSIAAAVNRPRTDKRRRISPGQPGVIAATFTGRNDVPSITSKLAVNRPRDLSTLRCPELQSLGPSTVMVSLIR